MKGSTAAYSSFVLLTFVYFLIISFSFRPSVASGATTTTSGGGGGIWFIVYMMLVAAVQSGAIFATLNEAGCSGPTGASKYILMGLGYWAGIFVLTTYLIEWFDGWRTIFSNTFGYMVVSMFGLKKTVDTFFTRIMTNHSEQDKKDIFNMIYRDRSLLVNELTTTNLRNFVEIMVGSTKLDTITGDPGFSAYTYMETLSRHPEQQAAVKGMEFILNAKDNVARFVWYILAGMTTITLVNSIVGHPSCGKSVADIKADANEKTVGATGPARLS